MHCSSMFLHKIYVATSKYTKYLANSNYALRFALARFFDETMLVHNGTGGARRRDAATDA